jgi:hypothetical protein
MLRARSFGLALFYIHSYAANRNDRL